MKLASIETIKSITTHPNADALDIAKILNYDCIVKKGQYVADEKVLFIQPDTVLPDAQWTSIYKAKSNRVKTIKLRGVLSQGIVEKLATVGLTGDEEGCVASLIGVTKYEAPVPADLSAKGTLPFGIPITDEERWENIDPLPLGKVVDISLKRDGKSFTVFCKKTEDQWVVGICGRRFEYKSDGNNDYVNTDKSFNVSEKLLKFCKEKDISLAIRGEICGGKIQGFKNNPHTGGPLTVRFFSTYLLDELTYARKGHPYYIFDLCKQLELNSIELLEKDVILDIELIRKYSDQLKKIDGKTFEGVVVKGEEFSFKIINLHYDLDK